MPLFWTRTRSKIEVNCILNEGMATKSSSNGGARDVVQVKNPRTKHYVKIDRSAGKIVAHRKSDGPYQGVPIARKRK